MEKQKILFIPNWNGHLFLQDYRDIDNKSISKLFKESKFENKELIEIEQNNIENTNKIIENKFLENLKENENILSITGDHSNSYPLIKAYSKQFKNKDDFKIVIFDAHPDVEVSTDSISHEDYLRNLIEDNLVNPQNIYLFGIRTFSREEFEYLISKKINFFSITDVLRDKEKIEKILTKIKDENENIYLTIDIDVLDPDVAPGTYYREWCGLNLEELIKFTNILKPKLKYIDISEFYSEKDENEITKKNIFKLIDSLIYK